VCFLVSEVPLYVIQEFPMDSKQTGAEVGNLRVPHGGVRPFRQKSTCLAKSTLGHYVVQIRSRNPGISEATNPSISTKWHGTVLVLYFGVVPLVAESEEI
jgi:hypothetical protein